MKENSVAETQQYPPRDPNSDDPNVRYRGFVTHEKQLVPEDHARKLGAERWAAHEVAQTKSGIISSSSSAKQVARPAARDVPTCVLVKPTGSYNVSPREIARFDVETSAMMSEAIKKLNGQKIVPTITSGYRSPAYQQNLRRSGKGITPAKVSRHQIGEAVDFGTNSNQGHHDAIRKAMTDAGFIWGGTFKHPRPDPVHYQLPAGGRPIDPDLVKACERAMRGE